MKTSMSDHADEYLRRLTRLSPATTVRNNRTALTRFARWRDGQRKSPRTLQGWEVEDYLTAMADDVSPGTWNNYMILTLKFLRWGVPRGYWPAGAVVEMQSRRAEPRPRLYLDDDQMDRAMDLAPDLYTRFCLAALRWSLCREQELLAMKLKDVDLAGAHLRIVRTKGRRANPQDKVDLIPVVGELDDELRAWLREYEQLCGPLQSEWRLIPRRIASHWGPEPGWVYRPEYRRKVLGTTVKRAVAGILPDLTEEELKGVGAHTLRRSGGLEMRESLRDAGESEADHIVMAMFGHKSIQTTYSYFGEDRDRRRRDVALAGRRLKPKKAEVIQLKAVDNA